MLQGQDKAGIASAAGIAASMGAGLLEANRTGGTVKRVHCGWAAHCGVAAADQAPARAHRPADRAGEPLRVPAGVLRRPRPPGRRRPRPGHGLAAARGLQAVLVQPLHPRGRGRRPAAARPGARPRRRHSDRAGRRQARPAHDRRATRGQGTAASGYHAAFSGPYTVAAALLGGGPGNPLSDEGLARKFHDNAVRSLPEERAAELAARMLAFPDAQSVEDLTALLTSAGER